MHTPYEDLLAEIMDHGTHKGDRTGTGTTSLFARQIRFDLSESFPLITTKSVHIKSVVGELLWFLRGDSNVRWLQEHGIRIWNEWADDNGDLGPVYGVQWRSWPTPNGEHIDQIQAALDTLKNNPNSRRNIVSAWNVSELDNMALPPCHLLFQLYVADGKLSCQLYQRSADMFLGVPFNIASYSLLTHMFAQQAGLASSCGPAEIAISTTTTAIRCACSSPAIRVRTRSCVCARPRTCSAMTSRISSSRGMTPTP